MNPSWCFARVLEYILVLFHQRPQLYKLFLSYFVRDAIFRINSLNYPNISTIILKLLHLTFSSHHFEDPTNSFTHTFILESPFPYSPAVFLSSLSQHWMFSFPFFSPCYHRDDIREKKDTVSRYSLQQSLGQADQQLGVCVLKSHCLGSDFTSTTSQLCDVGRVLKNTF